jgi:hypothetical protein
MDTVLTRLRVRARVAVWDARPLCGVMSGSLDRGRPTLLEPGRANGSRRTRRIEDAGAKAR